MFIEEANQFDADRVAKDAESFQLNDDFKGLTVPAES